MHHWYQPHRRQNCHRYQRHWQQILPPAIPVANWEQYQAAETLKWTWRQKCIYRLTLLPKGFQTKKLKLLWLTIFCICHRCQRHRWQTLSCEYLLEFLKKLETALMVYSGAWGKLIHEKTRSLKSRDTVPLTLTLPAGRDRLTLTLTAWLLFPFLGGQYIQWQERLLQVAFSTVDKI